MTRVWLLVAVMSGTSAAIGIAQENIDPEIRVKESEQAPVVANYVSHSRVCNAAVACSCSKHGGCGRVPCCRGCCGHGDLWTREHLTNGFWGVQPALAEHGIVYDAQLTQFYQGVANGGREQTFEYGGKLDQFMIFQGEKLGLWKGLEVVMHAETRFGEDVITDAATLSPVNINMLYPTLENETAITGLQILQALNEDWAITFGRINTLDLFETLYPQTGRGVDGFMNTSVFLPLTVGTTIPLVFNGAGILKMREEKIQGGVLVLDPRNIPTVSGLDDMFSNGASIVGLWRQFTELGGNPGSHMFVGSWASGDFAVVDNPWPIIGSDSPTSQHSITRNFSSQNASSPNQVDVSEALLADQWPLRAVDGRSTAVGHCTSQSTHDVSSNPYVAFSAYETASVCSTGASKTSDRQLPWSVFSRHVCRSLNADLEDALSRAMAQRRRTRVTYRRTKAEPDETASDDESDASKRFS